MEFKKYLGKYATSADVQSAVDNKTLSKPYVAYIENDDVIDWNSKVDYSTVPFTFEILSDGNIVYKVLAIPSSYARVIQYSKDNGETWTSVVSSTGGTAIPVVAGDKVQFRGNNSSYGGVYYNGFADSTAKFKVYGNIMSLINSTNFSGLTTLSAEKCFNRMFYYCTAITDASNLVFPATTLTKECYKEMFQNCTNLTGAPALPATTLPEGCYYSMFRNCSNLNYIKCLATDISATNCTYTWVANVASTGRFVTPASTNWTTGSHGIPSGWTRVDA